MNRIAYLSLGCFKNLVDTEKMISGLMSSGLDVLPGRSGFSGIEGADAIVINTCGFIDAAKEESIEAILDAVKEKKAGRIKIVAVVGCMVELYKEYLAKEIPEVDLWLGLGEIGSLPNELCALLGAPVRRVHAPPRVITTPSHVSFLKISEGCSHGCTFCLIPKIRGPFRSRTPDEIINEAEYLESRGVMEINIIAQDTARYGADRGEKEGLSKLLSRLLDRTGVPWYRLLYVHPESLSDELIAVMSGSKRILNYLDLPFQHISAKILRSMGRRQSREEIIGLVERLRSSLPGLALRTTMLVGFPGETREDFDALLEFVRETRFDWLGAFVFSPQEGTKAYSLPGRVSEEEAEERREELLDAQIEINMELNEAKKGAVETVLVDGTFHSEGFDYIGRTRGQAYEIDGAVLLKGRFNPGKFAKVRITDFEAYDLVGESAE